MMVALAALCAADASAQDWSRPVHLNGVQVDLTEDETIQAGSVIGASCIRFNGHKLILHIPGKDEPSTVFNAAWSMYYERPDQFTTDDPSKDWRWVRNWLGLRTSYKEVPCQAEDLRFADLRLFVPVLLNRWIEAMLLFHSKPFETSPRGYS